MINKLFDMTGRCALVTGGSKGIGKAVARGYAEAGANVVISARTEADLKEAVGHVQTVLNSGAATEKLSQLAEWTRAHR